MFFDNDNDYFAMVQMSSTKPITPAGNWTDVITNGPDCDDNLFSADNSVCVATPPPCTNKTICDKGSSMVNCECVEDTPPPPIPCKEAVNDKLKSLTQSNFAAIINKFTGTNSIYKVNIIVGSLGGDPALAQTTNSGTYRTYNITLNENYLPVI